MLAQIPSTNSASAVSIDRYGKDHWSMLAYVETLCVDSPGSDGVGRIDLRRVRCNGATHQLLNANATVGWKPQYGTRLRGFFDFSGRANPDAAAAAGLQIKDHDDWDCLDDLADAGLVDILSLVNGFVKMTPTGLDVSAQLRQHKATGGMFASFVPAAMPVTTTPAVSTPPAPIPSSPRPR